MSLQRWSLVQRNSSSTETIYLVTDRGPGTRGRRSVIPFLSEGLQPAFWPLSLHLRFPEEDLVAWETPKDWGFWTGIATQHGAIFDDSKDAEDPANMHIIAISVEGILDICELCEGIEMDLHLIHLPPGRDWHSAGPAEQGPWRLNSPAPLHIGQKLLNWSMLKQLGVFREGVS